ncbi:zinc chelation protein SecC [Marinomonas agarivorans]|nr:zinc chelation protein SecC [Marinomonas agarivorans]
MTTPAKCPCGSDLLYDACCGVFHNTSVTAPTAEALMRSRYSAFYLKNFNYIESTQQLPDAPDQSAQDIKEANETTQWLKLEVLETIGGQEQDEEGMVAFSAHFKEGRHTGKLQERSLFKKVNNQWFYISGEHEVKQQTPLVTPAEMKLGRNEPCHCGSGKKFKKCCG